VDPVPALLPWRRWPPEAAALCFFLDARRGAVGWERRVVMGTTAPLP
jgi:hypothetical protein